MLQSITWLILRNFKKIILIRKNHKLESTGGCGGGSDCSASRVIILPEEQQKEDLQLKTYHHRNCMLEIHTSIP